MSKAPMTRVTLIAGCAPHSPQRKQRLDEWYKLYKDLVNTYVRYSFRNGTPQQIEDLAQDFLAEKLMGEWMSGWKPGGRRFHSYLAAGIQYFVLDRHRKANSEARAQDALLAAGEADPDEVQLAATPLTPDEASDLIWACHVWDSTLRSLREEREAKTLLQFDILWDFLVGQNSSTLKEVAARLNWAESTVKKEKSLLRKEFRARLTRMVAEDLDEGEDVEAAVREVITLLKLRKRAWTSPGSSTLT